MPSPESLFALANSVALVGWMLLAVAPGWRWTERLVRSGAWSLALSVAYLVLIVIGLTSDAEGGFGSLGEVRTFFGNDTVLLAGWIHYLAFDLYVGAVTTRIARREGIPHVSMLPVLFVPFDHAGPYFGTTRNSPPVLVFSIIHTAPSGATATSRIW